MAKKPDWFTQPVKGRHESDVPLPEGARTDSDIDEMFETAFGRAPDSEFLSSLHGWWEEKGFLTEKQYEALLKFTGGER